MKKKRERNKKEKVVEGRISVRVNSIGAVLLLAVIGGGVGRTSGGVGRRRKSARARYTWGCERGGV